MILDIFKFIKHQGVVSHYNLAKFFPVEEVFLEDMINILCKKNIIKIEYAEGLVSKSLLSRGCYKKCIMCDKSNIEISKSNCYYKIT